MLAWTIYISFLGAAALLCVPRHQPVVARFLALAVALAGCAIAVAGFNSYRSAAPGGTLEIVRVAWIPQLGATYHLAANGISLTLVLLTGIASVAGVLFSWNVERRAGEFFALYLALIGGVYGVFLSADLFLLFVFYEIAIVPKYFLIAAWGSTRREYGAMKLALYSFAGSGMVLVGMIAAYVVSRGHSFDLADLANYPYPAAFQFWAFALVFIGFAVLAGLWPFHSWAPTGHVAAPTAASMLLAGVVMKLGAYGALRVAMTLFPLGLAAWRLPMALLATVGIVYGALAALAQRDFKFVIGYSSVSHMGFVLLGLMTLSQIGLSGAVLQMFSHGIVASLLFGIVGRMIYDRTHTRDLSLLQPMNLFKALPFAAAAFAFAAAASMGLPGFSGFVAEIQVLLAARSAFSILMLAAGLGALLAVAYMLRALIQAFFVDRENGVPAPGPERLAPISWPERGGALILLATTVVIGLYPRLLLDVIVPTLNGAVFAPILRGGGL
jgi:NADH-quinone oxidoreductase subunit M